ncbi:regulatory protein RecX [Prosthecochloris sp. GSB1]|uniref:regulatory protein RecX n=1 Tax=Prosthecochloris sp. GSB1 TaxID=281093 RepID=UPI000B8D03DC|nr:regulatory protein RecX [Prosthecochloris sp. GSB1]ASQ91144.1 regulatory protein RecX [Prosthecochloris sp. GSB1]
MLDDTEKKAFDHAIRFLGNREHSRREIVSKLERRGFSTEAIEKTLQRLESLELLDDRTFAMHYIGSRSRSKPSGRYKLRHELLKKGVAEEIVEEALGDFDGAAHCLDAALRKLPLLKGDLYHRRRKLHAFLTGRGFDGQTVRETLDKVLPS